MAFEYRFNVIRFYSKLNRFVLSPRKKPNHFVLKIRPGGFADYTVDNTMPRMCEMTVNAYDLISRTSLFCDTRKNG